MIPLLGIHDAAAGEKQPAGRQPAAALLQQAEVDMEGQVLAGVVAQEVDDMVQLLPLRNLKDHLPLPLLDPLRPSVELEAERPLEELGKPPREVGILRDDPHLRGVEGIAVQQNAVGLRPGTAQLLDRKFT